MNLSTCLQWHQIINLERVKSHRNLHPHYTLVVPAKNIIIPSYSHYSTYFISLFSFSFLTFYILMKKGRFLFSIKGKVCSCCPHLESLLCPYFIIISNFLTKKQEWKTERKGTDSMWKYFRFLLDVWLSKDFSYFFCNSWPLLNQENSFFLGKNFLVSRIGGSDSENGSA